MEPKREKAAPERQAPEARPKAAPTLENPVAGLDFAKLDLTVERVEERISPSETNVFDK